MHRIYFKLLFFRHDFLYFTRGISEYCFFVVSYLVIEEIFEIFPFTSAIQRDEDFFFVVLATFLA